jgi:hypothetical protein
MVCRLSRRTEAALHTSFSEEEVSGAEAEASLVEAEEEAWV